MKIISKLLSTLIFLSLIFIIYLSLFGIETQKFNSQIIGKVKNIDKNLNIKLNTIKVVLDPFRFKINAKTIGPKLINKNKILEIENIKTTISIKALFDEKFSIENLEISTKSLEVNNLISFLRSTYQKPELYLLEKVVKKGFLIADIKLDFDNQGKIKNNYELSGFLKDGKLSLNNKYKIDKLNLSFDLKKDQLIIDNANFRVNDLNFYSNEVTVKNLVNSFSVQGKVEHKRFNLKNNSLTNLLNEFDGILKLETLNFSSKNNFSFNISKKLKIKDVEVLSKVKIAELSILNDFKLKGFFPKIKKKISLNDNNLEVLYKKESFSIFGEGKILFQDKADNISYELIKTKRDLKFVSSIQMNNNPLNIAFLNYDNREKNNVIINIKGTRDKNQNSTVNLFSLKEKNNVFDIKNLKFNKKNQVVEIGQLKFVYFDKDKKKNSISISNKKKEYLISGSYINANFLIDKILNENNETGNILNINSKFGIDINNIGLDEGSNLSDVKGYLVSKNQKIIKGNLEGFFTKNEKFRLTINKTGNNKITTLFIDKAEPIVKRYKFIKGFDGGKLDFYSSSNDKETESTLKIYNFKLKNLPVLTKILTLASLQGIADILSGEGIRFDEFEMNFRNKDNLMTIDEIYAIGPSISILMSGYIEKDKLVSLRGTLVPASTINKFIGSLPVLGDILVGSKTGEGVFGVSFKIKGPSKNLTTTVNPVKTLTPRFITRTLEKIKKN